MSHPSDRLEEMLQYWEDQCFLYGIVAEYGERLGYPEDMLQRFPFVGPLRHWSELRSHLRMIGKNRGSIDRDRFMTCTTSLVESHGSMLQFPHYLRDWTVSSRRIFHLSEELQALLTGMSFQGVSLSEVELPFDSFAVTLEAPLVADIDTYDVLLVSRLYVPEGLRGSEGGGLSIGFTSQRLGDYKALAVYDKDRLRKAARKGLPSAKALLLRYLQRLPDPGPFRSASIGPATMTRVLADKPLSKQLVSVDLFGETSEGARLGCSAVDRGFRLIPALCLYLLSLPPGSPHRSQWTKPPKRGNPDPRAVTNDAMICTVTSSFTLSAEERSVFLDPRQDHDGSELSTHFRRGHFRRRPGEGSNPAAPKVILVKPALVRGDRLREGELPAGALTNAKP